MAEILSLLKSVTELDSGKGVLRCYLNSCSEQLSFTRDSSKIPSLVSLINTKLNEPSSRYDGMLLLLYFLPQCSQEVLADNASTWMLLCLKGTSGQHSSSLAFDVLKLLFKLSRELPEMTKVVSATIIPNLAEQIVRNVPTQGLYQALECLEECFDKYNGPCGPHKRVWERFLIPLVDYSGPQAQAIICQAARCMALLPQVGGGGTGGSMYACSWSDQQKVICRSIHLVLDEMFTDVNEVQIFQAGDVLEDCQPLPLPALETSNPIHRVQMLTARLSGLISYLQAMLLVRFPAPKKIAVSSILNLICRGLAVNNASFSSNTTTHSLALVSVLPKLQCCLMNLLRSLIVVCRSNLMPFASLICKLAVQTLKWTCMEQWPYGTERPYRSLRVQAYMLIVQWCGVAKCGSLIQDVADNITEMAIADFFTELDSVTLSADLSRHNKYAHRKQAKQKAAVSNSSNISNGGLHHQPTAVGSVCATANVEICTAALQALRAMVGSASSIVNPNVHKTLQEAVVSALIDVTKSSSTPLIPFSANTARLELYQMLLALVLNPHPLWPSPYSVALKLFAAGLNDKDLQVSMFCKSALSCVEKIIHPSHSSLHLQVPLEDILSTVQNSHSCRASIMTSNDAVGKEGSDKGNLVSEKNVHRLPRTSDLSPKISSPMATPVASKSRSSNESFKKVSPAVEKNSCSSSNPPSITLESSEDEEIPVVGSLAIQSVVSKHRSPSQSNKEVTLQEERGPSVVSKSPTPIVVDNSRKISIGVKLNQVKGSIEEVTSVSTNCTIDGDEESSSIQSQNIERMLLSSPENVQSTKMDLNLTSGLHSTEHFKDVDKHATKPDNIQDASFESFTVESDDNVSVSSVDSHVSITLDDDSEASDCEISHVDASEPDAKHSPVKPATAVPNTRAKELVTLETASETSSEVQNDVSEELKIAAYNSPVREAEQSTSHASPVLTPRVLRSRTISNSSGASTPGKKKPRLTSTLSPTAEEEEHSAGSLKADDKNGEPESKKSRYNDEEDDNLDAMLSSFVDVTQGHDF